MPKPLDGVIVLETASFVSGPYVGQLLADLGADVIKIENPKGGDPFRGVDGYASDFQSYNPGKRSVALDITTAAGADVMRKLIAKADVLVHNFRPGVMERLDFGWDKVSALNDRLIYCTLTGFGHDGPYQHRPSYNSVAGALSGFLSQYVSAGDTQIKGPAVADAITGLYACYGVLGALVERGRTGRGCRIDSTMVEVDDRVFAPAICELLRFWQHAVAARTAVVFILFRFDLFRRQAIGDPYLLAAEILGRARVGDPRLQARH